MPQKEEMKKVSLNIDAAKTKDLGHGVVEVIISTNRTDYHGESIDVNGINTKEYHGTVLYGHDYEGLPIGKAIRVWKDKTAGSLRAKLQFAIEEYPFAKTVYDLVRGGYLTDVSIGGMVDKWSDDYTVIEKMTMKEFSVVPIGANHEAQIVAMSIGKSMEDIRGEYVSAVNKSMQERLKALPQHEIKDALKSMKTIIAALEGEVEAISEEPANSISRTKLVRLKQGAKELDRNSEAIIKVVKLIKKGN